MKLLSLLLLLPLMITCMTIEHPQSCHEVEQDIGLPSQVYTIYPAQFGSGVQVFCDMDTDRGRWTVFQRRLDGSLNFFRRWLSYKEGFGNPAGEYWLGLEKLHQLTKDGLYQLRVVLEDFDGNKVYAQYDSFQVDDECEDYTLHVSGFSDGGAGDSLSYHDGQKFSTVDHDNSVNDTNCPQRFLGGFWYNSCYHTNPNGVYQWGPVSNHYFKGVVWSSWLGYGYSLKSITMMFRPFDGIMP